jgi:hypothetical protein
MTTPVDQENEDGDTAGEKAEGENIRYLCMKYNRYQEGDLLACQDPRYTASFARPVLSISRKKTRAWSSAGPMPTADSPRRGGCHPRAVL